MRELNLIGDIDSLSAGIVELCQDLDFKLSNSGINVYITQKDESNLLVDFKDNEAYIIYAKKIHFFRGLSLLMQHLQIESEFHLCEKPQFDMNGPMFDVSQGNAVIKVLEIKKTIRQMAQMGLNTLMLYCEDSFDVENQPYFGYMRSRYKEEEMRDCDDYADMFGIEMIPCIQTLAHFWDVLKWHVFDDIYENECCLLVDEQKTYQFLYDLISSASKPFRSKRIHIGMDEENYEMQVFRGFARIRHKVLYWKFVHELIERCEKNGSRVAMYGDHCWDHPDDFVANVPKSVLISNWYYNHFKDWPVGDYNYKGQHAYEFLEKHGYDQLPTCSTWLTNENPMETVANLKKTIAPERLTGFQCALWARMCWDQEHYLKNDIQQLYLARRNYYPETLEKEEMKG